MKQAFTQLLLAISILSGAVSAWFCLSTDGRSPWPVGTKADIQQSETVFKVNGQGPFRVALGGSIIITGNCTFNVQIDFINGSLPEYAKL